MRFIAQELREIMAKLGFRKLERHGRAHGQVDSVEGD